MSKRFVGLSKSERAQFERLILGLAFKYTEEAENFYPGEDDQDLSQALFDFLSTTRQVANQKAKSEDYCGEEEILEKSPRDIKEVLDKYMIGQDAAKRIMSVAFFNHVRRIKAYDLAVSLGKEVDFSINKSNVIVLGSTGTGKTYLVEILSKIFDLPFYNADASTITQAGFVGKNAHDLVEQLFLASGKDIKKTERGIIFLDEIDKLSNNKSHDKQGSMAEGAQQSLLKMVEGADVEIEIEEGNKRRKVVINTKNILFVFSGAFVGLVGDVEKKKEIKLVPDENEEEVKNKKVMPADLIKYGLIPELVGRISMIAQMHQLEKDHLIEIIKNSKNNVIEQYQNLFKGDDIEVIFDENTYEEIAAKALELKTGARALKSIVDYLMVDKIYDIDLSEDSKTSQIIIDAEYTKDKLKNFNKVNNDV